VASQGLQSENRQDPRGWQQRMVFVGPAKKQVRLEPMGDMAAIEYILLPEQKNEIGAALTGFLNSRCCEATVTFSGSVAPKTRRSPSPPL
jgi:hypothetical protein